MRAASAMHKKNHQRRADPPRPYARTGGCDPTGREVNNRQTLEAGSLLQQVERRLDVPGIGIELFLAHDARLSDLAHDRPLVPYRLDDVTGARLTLGTDESSTLGNAT